jgi:hydroxyethylthiazole kinase-like uncharacterized protein yjeF
MSSQRIDANFLRANPLPKPAREGDKQVRGKVLVIAGSVEMPGAALLAGLGVLRAGAGILQIATCKTVAPHLGLAMPEAMVIGCTETSLGGINPSAADRLIELASDSDVVLIGPGILDKKAVGQLTRQLLTTCEGPAFVLDALSFTCLGKDSNFSENSRKLIVTPHAGEMASFLGECREQIEADPLSSAKRASAALQAIVALKGANTHIVCPEGGSWVCEHGSISRATSGSGDTLAGILAGMLARGAPLRLAAQWSVYAHAEAGLRLARNGTFGLLARELPGEIPRILMDLAAQEPAV